MALTLIERAEMRYWRSLVYQYMLSQEDWRYPDEATDALLTGKHNQQYVTDQIEYPVLRWRMLNDRLSETAKKK